MDRAVEAQPLLDRRADEPRFALELLALPGMLEQREHGVADQADGRLVPGLDV
ncbi:MAG TPA: hypothetical protein VF094_11655 [Gaiellaceae bacterium]